MKRVAIYVRVSTSDKRQDTETQLLPLREYVKQREWEIYKIYEDQESGSKENRPKLLELLQDAKRLKFDAVLVFRFDRFSRSTKQLIESLETFKALKIDFISYQEAIDTTTPAGAVMFTMISAFAQFERAIIQERVRAGINRARADGKILGRPKAPINLQELFKLKSQGLSIRKIAGELGVPKSTVANHLVE